MKKALLILVILLICTSCAKSPIIDDEQISIPTTINVKVSFARTFAYEGAGSFMWKKTAEYQEKEGSLPFTVIENQAQLEQFEKQAVFYFDLDYNWDQLDNFYDVFASFDSDYFDENNLIVASFSQPSGSIRNKLGSAYIKDDILYIEIKEIINSDGMTDDIASWFALVSVNKKDMNNVKSLAFNLSNNYSVADYAPDHIYPEGTSSPIRVTHVGYDTYVFDNKDSKVLRDICKSLEFSKTFVTDNDSPQYMIDIENTRERYIVNVEKGYIRKIDISGDRVLLSQAKLGKTDLDLIKLIFSRLKGNL